MFWTFVPVCFNKRCRKEKNQISNLFFPIYDNEKKIKNESNGMKERAWGHKNGFTMGCGVVRLYGTIAVSDEIICALGGQTWAN